MRSHLARTLTPRSVARLRPSPPNRGDAAPATRVTLSGVTRRVRRDATSKATLGPHKALYSVRQHKKIGLTVWRVILNYFFRRYLKPFIPYPGIPPIFWVSFVTKLYLKFRLYGIGYPATEKRFFVSVWVLGVIR